MIFLQFNRHSKAGLHSYHSEIWSDKAGYYMYLPATFKYSYQPEKFPEGIDTLTGKGFVLDYENNLVRDKYTCGIAILQIPFYLTADLLAKPLGFKADGFSEIYHKSINIAAAFYLFAGLAFLVLFLKFQYSLKTSIITTLLIFSASHLFYYAIDETGMTHLYSFSLVAILLYFFRKTVYLTKVNFLQLLLMGFILGLIVLIRPINIFILSAFFFLDLDKTQEIKDRIVQIFRKSPLLFIGFVVAILPQLIYWKYTYGSFFYYSYGVEGFDVIRPEWVKFLISPRSGIFTYTPLFFLIILGGILMMKKRKINGFYLVSLFVFLSYFFSCWWDWGYGCSFGSRNLVEYLPLFALPLAFLIHKILTSNKMVSLSAVLVLFLIALNLKIFYSFDDCFYGEDWEWSIYWRYIFGPTV